MIEGDWAAQKARSTPRIFDWDLTARGCPSDCDDWRHGHAVQTEHKPSSTHLEIPDDEPFRP